MKGRVILVVLVLSATTVAQAGTVLVIDDFTDPAQIEMPGGPESVVTPNVGDLNAERTLRYAGADRLTIAAADSSTTTPGHYSVAFEETGLVLHTDVVYTDFTTADLTQGGRNDAFIIDVTSAPASGPPAVTLFAWEESGRILMRDFPTSSLFFPPTTPSRVVVPFSSFTRRDGVPVFDATLSSVTQVVLRFGAGSGRPAFQVTIDRLSVGNSSIIPEPASLALVLFVLVVSASCRAFSVRWSRAVFIEAGSLRLNTCSSCPRCGP